MTTVQVINISVISQSLFVCSEYLRFTLSKFQAYNTLISSFFKRNSAGIKPRASPTPVCTSKLHPALLLATIIKLYYRSPDLVDCLITASYTFDQFLPIFLTA